MPFLHRSGHWTALPRVKHELLPPLASIGAGALIVLLLSLLVAEPPAATSQRESFIFTAAGDYGATNSATATLNGIRNSGATFNLALGDFSYSELTPESAWCDYVKTNVGSTFPFELVAGNHEDNGPDGVIDKFARCLPDRIGGLVGTYGKEYYFDYLNLARFILISPGLTFDNQTYKYFAGSQRYNWVANAIDEARVIGIKWVIVGMHKTCFTMGTKTCEIGPDITNLLVRKKVDLVLQAHDHTYQRSKQIALRDGCSSIVPDSFDADCVVDQGDDDQYTKGTGTVFIIIGSGGAGLNKVYPDDPEAPYFATWMGANITPRKGFLKVTVSDTTLAAQFVGSTSTSGFTDSFSISSNTGTTTTTFTPVADAYVDNEAPTSNFGSALILSADRSPHRLSFLKFDVDGLSGTVTSGRLRLYVRDSSSSGGAITTTSDTQWSESSITYDNHPVLDGAVLASQGAVTKGHWVEFDVTQAIRGNGTVSFALRSNVNDGVDYASREDSTHAPQLLVTTAS